MYEQFVTIVNTEKMSYLEALMYSKAKGKGVVPSYWSNDAKSRLTYFYTENGLFLLEDDRGKLSPVHISNGKQDCNWETNNRTLNHADLKLSRYSSLYNELKRNLPKYEELKKLENELKGIL